MLHTTHKTWTKLIAAGALVAFIFVAFSFTKAVQAQVYDMQITAKVQKAVKCFSYARTLDKPREVQQVYLRRIGEASNTAGATYYLGYTEGLTAGLASANAKVLGGYVPAKKHAAEYMYKLEGCTINESI